MAIGQITKFPIQTVLEYATSGQHGLCPQLCGSVSDELSACDRNHPVSERGIRIAVNDVSGSIDYANLGSGYRVYSYTDEITAYYNTIHANTIFLSAFVSGETLILSAGTQSGGLPPVTGGVHVQGGKHQYSNTIEASDITTDGVVIANPVQDDLIAKTFIKCTVPFEQNSSTYSIGISSNGWENQTLITQDFYAPSAEGLVPFSYSNGMSAEYYWLTGDSEIKIYRTGTQCTSGEIGVSVFYDNVIWAPSYGYEFGTSSIDTIQRFNMDSDFVDSSDRGSACLRQADQYTAISHNSYIYTAGGRDDSTAFVPFINRLDAKNDTLNTKDMGVLTTARGFMGSAKSSLKAYFIYGVSTTYHNNVDNISFASDSSNSSSNIITTSPRSGPCGLQNASQYYTAGGKKAAGVYTTIIEKVLFASDTSLDSTIYLTAPRGLSVPFNTAVYGYVVGGEDFSGALNTIERVKFTNDAVSTLTSEFIVTTSDNGHSFQNNIDGYFYHGSVVEKYNFSNGTVVVTQSEPFRDNQSGTYSTSV